MEEGKGVGKRVRDESEEPESDNDSPEVKRLRENLLNGLEDVPDFCTSSQDLDSFMKSFEEEITASPSAAAGEGEAGAVRPTAHPGESRPELGYLLEATDDELGIPPPTTYPDGMKGGLGTGLVRLESDSHELGSEFWEFPSYDTFGFGFGFGFVLGEADNVNSEYVAIDGLFDYSDVGVGSGDFPLRPETLPAQ